VTGTLINVAAMLFGAVLGLGTRKDPDAATQAAIKFVLGLFIVWTGLKITWWSLHGTFWQVLGQFGLAALSLSLGHATGNLLKIQRQWNRLGQFAKEILTPQGPSRKVRRQPTAVFLACTAVFAANPLGLYGALLEGIGGHWEVLTIKAAMDGLSAMAFARTLGWPVLLAAVPVLAVQGTVTLLAGWAAQVWLSDPMIETLAATGGLLVFSVALVVWDTRKVKLADYLPAFLYAPLLAWWLR
jgi:uncharacterized membrane protein YqgA involved in biofilm formation